MLAFVARFPVGMYHAQAQSSFGEPEWPPHPLRLVAALVAASRAGSARNDAAASAVVDRIAAAGPPVIVAPRLSDDGVVALRGASRWAPRNHELSELSKGVSPRDPGRGRSEVEKIGVAIGDHPVAFAWPDLDLGADERAALERLVQDVTVIGTSRSPVILTVDAAYPIEKGSAWRPEGSGAVAVRVADARSPRQYDEWHDQRRGGRNGAPARAPLVVVPRIGVTVRYAHDHDAPGVPDLDPRIWGEMLVLAVDRQSEMRPMAASTLAFARATRSALLASFGPEGSTDEAPPILRAHGREAHAAFVPLSFIGDPSHGRTARHATGRTLGIGLLLPHEGHAPDVLLQRAAVVERLAAFVAADGVVRVPGVGPVRLAKADDHPNLATLRDARLRQASRLWTTATPAVPSRYLRRRTRAGRYDDRGLLDQVANDCAHVGLPRPLAVQERRAPRLPGSPWRVLTRDLPEGWRRSAEGPSLHLDLEFERPIVGPVLIGRARHFGVGLCLPYSEEDDA